MITKGGPLSNINVHDPKPIVIRISLPPEYPEFLTLPLYEAMA